MKRTLGIALLMAALLGLPAPAAADVTFFLGASPTPAMRSTRGFAGGISFLVVGFEFDYAFTAARESAGAPSLRTGMMNVVVMTPTKTQLYLTAGAGFFRETLLSASETSFGTNVGGGVKITLLGPVQVRLDYRVFSLRGNPHYKNPQRFYAGLNLPF